MNFSISDRFASGRPDLAAPKYNSPTTTTGTNTSEAAATASRCLPRRSKDRSQYLCQGGIYHSRESMPSQPASMASVISRADVSSRTPAKERKTLPASPRAQGCPNVSQYARTWRCCDAGRASTRRIISSFNSLASVFLPISGYSKASPAKARVVTWGAKGTRGQTTHHFSNGRFFANKCRLSLFALSERRMLT